MKAIVELTTEEIKVLARAIKDAASTGSSISFSTNNITIELHVKNSVPFIISKIETG